MDRLRGGKFAIAFSTCAFMEWSFRSYNIVFCSRRILIHRRGFMKLDTFEFAFITVTVQHLMPRGILGSHSTGQGRGFLHSTQPFSQRYFTALILWEEPVHIYTKSDMAHEWNE
jgi:hypothetical protein